MTQAAPAQARTRVQIPDKTLRTDSWWRAPAACAVREPHATYSGKTRFPLIMQNLHRYRIWTRISWLNARHMQLAWITLGTLMLTDLYIWLVVAGTFSDLRFFN